MRDSQKAGSASSVPQFHAASPAAPPRPDRPTEPVKLAQVVLLPPRLATWMFVVALIGMTLVGAGLRLYQLDRPSFWADELYSIRSITADTPPPLWRVLAHSATWAGLTLSGADLENAHRHDPEQWRALGINEFSARIGPAVIGILSIPILALVGRRVLGDRGAILLALLLAVMPWHVEWSQNARFYIGLFLFYGLCVLLYFDATTRHSRARLVMAMLCLVLAFMHHPPAIFLAGVFAADWAISRGMLQKPRLYTFGYLCVVTGVALCLLLLVIDMQTMSAGYERLEGQDRGHDTGMLLAATAYLVHPVLLVAAGLTAWLLLIRRERLGGYLLMVSLVPLAALVWLTATDRMFIHVRYGFMASIGYVALAALGLERVYGHLAPRFGRVFGAMPAVAVIVALLLMDLFYHSGGYGFRSRWEEGFAYVQQQRQPGDVVSTSFTLAGRYYLEDRDVVGFPASRAALEAMPGPIWLVTAVESAQGVEAEQWIHEVAVLKAYFDTQIEQPYSSVRVYRYEGK